MYPVYKLTKMHICKEWKFKVFVSVETEWLLKNKGTEDFSVENNFEKHKISKLKCFGVEDYYGNE